MPQNLAEKKCVPCEIGTPPFSAEKVAEYSQSLKTAWEVRDNKKLHREFVFKDFKEAMAFVNAVAVLAESEGHHPDILIFYNKVAIELWTHASGGLTENDFILAAKIELLNTS
ncbi:MAG: 4a-hydroxytetrahydrobiopterin dehydratase [Candidatus Sungbacteria bacterium]|nr:4a-hydroxytetrahydrobiopterin dehydratase [Candidatus Sungbacteria bacterium]